MNELEKRLTISLLDHLEAINHYWSIIRGNKALIAEQKLELKFLKKENNKLVKNFNALYAAKIELQKEIQMLKQRLNTTIN